MDTINKKNKPLLPEELFDFHFKEDWKMKIGGSHPIFHINRIEDVIDYLKFPVTLPSFF